MMWIFGSITALIVLVLWLRPRWRHRMKLERLHSLRRMREIADGYRDAELAALLIGIAELGEHIEGTVFDYVDRNTRKKINRAWLQAHDMVITDDFEMILQYGTIYYFDDLAENIAAIQAAAEQGRELETVFAQKQLLERIVACSGTLARSVKVIIGD